MRFFPQTDKVDASVKIADRPEETAGAFPLDIECPRERSAEWQLD